MGLLQQKPETWFSTATDQDGGIAEAEIDALVAARLAARAAKNWAESDRIRDQLKAQGVLVEDSKDGQRWRRI